MKSILVIGASSNLGYYLTKNLKGHYKIYGTFNKNSKKNIYCYKSFFLNADASISLIRQVLNFKPSVVIHCAAIASIEECEKNIHKAIKVNSLFPSKIAKVCKFLNIKFIFISTDQLFKGDKVIYSESDMVYPLNSYAKSKVYAENFIFKNNRNSLVLRFSFIGKGPINGKNLFDFVYDNLTLNKEIYGYSDIFFTPISLNYFIFLIKKILQKNIYGIYNLASNSTISKLELCKLIATRYNLNHKLIKETKYHLGRLKSSKIKRPRNMSLDASKINKILGITGKKFEQMNW